MLRHKKSPERSGAALIIAIVVLALLGIVASTALPQLLRDRQESRKELLKQQTERLLDDALRKAETQRKTDTAFVGETITLGPDQQPFPGTFRLTTRFETEKNAFAAEAEFRNDKDRILYSKTRN